MWPQKLCEITTSTVLRMDAKANKCIRKWLGLPWGLSNIGLFGKNILQLPLKSINLGYRQEKVRPSLELRNSTDPFVKKTKKQWGTGSNGTQVEGRRGCRPGHQQADAHRNCWQDTIRVTGWLKGWSGVSRSSTRSERSASGSKDVGQPGREWSTAPSSGRTCLKQG